jgi:RHS repeat-associated protein
VVSSSRYNAWGVRTTVGAQDAASFGFTGHLEHKELGLVFTLYRAYDPATGRWLSRDPIGENGGINLYGYVANNPINLWDPLGLWVFGGGVNITAGLGVGVDINIQLVVDTQGGVGLSYNGGLKLGLWAGLGLSPAGSVSTACTIDDTTGPGGGVDVDFLVGSVAATVGSGNNEVDWRELFGGHSYGNPPPAHPFTLSGSGPGLGGSAGVSVVGGGTGVVRFW